MVAHYHLDTDFVIYALTTRGKARARLRELAAADALIAMSAIAWYEFHRGPRTPEQMAAARFFVGDDGVVAFTPELAERAGEVFRSLGSPRKRVADIAIGVTAQARGATLLTMNTRDFTGIDGLRVETGGA